MYTQSERSRKVFRLGCARAYLRNRMCENLLCRTDLILKLGVGMLCAVPDGTKRATSVNVQPLRMQKDLRTGSISRDIVNFPSELRSSRSVTLTEVARLVPPEGEAQGRGHERQEDRRQRGREEARGRACGAQGRAPRYARLQMCRMSAQRAAHQNWQA